MLNSAVYFIKDITISWIFPFSKYVGLEHYRDTYYSKTQKSWDAHCDLLRMKKAQITDIPLCQVTFISEMLEWTFLTNQTKKRPVDWLKSMYSPCSVTVNKKFLFSWCEPGFLAVVMEYHWQCRLNDFLIVFFLSFKTSLLPVSCLQHKFRAVVLLLKWWKINKCKCRSVKKWPKPFMRLTRKYAS